jgi:hypothetical protein
MLRYFLKQFQWLSSATKNSMQHECDIRAIEVVRLRITDAGRQALADKQ